jgi:hypothetical protein
MILTPEPDQVFRFAIVDLADIVAGRVDVDPDDREHWHRLFGNLDRRLPRTSAACEVIARVARELDGLVEGEESKAGRLLDAASANRTRARRFMGVCADQRPGLRDGAVSRDRPVAERGEAPTPPHHQGHRLSQLSEGSVERGRGHHAAGRMALDKATRALKKSRRENMHVILVQGPKYNADTAWGSAPILSLNVLEQGADICQYIL